MKFGLILFAITVILYPTSQILWKTGMGQVGSINNIAQLFHLNTLFRVATNPYIIGSTALAVVNMALWLGAMSTMNISYLYPFLSLSFIVLSIMAYFILKEPISFVNWVGVCVIVAGCFLINYGK